MPRYIIEREIPGAGAKTPEELQAISRHSCAVLQDLGPQVQCVRSHVTADKIFCVYLAQNEGLIRKHAEISGFPANRITEVKRTIDPTTASG